MSPLAFAVDIIAPAAATFAIANMLTSAASWAVRRDLVKATRGNDDTQSKKAKEDSVS
jgi:hypothetical protein